MFGADASGADVPKPITFIEPLSSAPFPVAENARNRDGTPFWSGRDDATGEPFRVSSENKRFPERAHYRDNRVLFAAPPHFNAAQPFRIVLFFHGHGSEIERTLVRELDLPGQIARSGTNTVLVAPQLARDAADSSPGRWLEPGLASVFLDEATERLRARLGGSAPAWQGAPVVLAAFSGGYRTMTAVLDNGAADRRIEGLVLLDALYGDVEIFARWLGRNRHRAFLWSLHSPSSRKETEALITQLLESGVPFSREDRAGPPAGIRFIAVDTPHVRIPTEGPPAEPLATRCWRVSDRPKVRQKHLV